MSKPTHSQGRGAARSDLPPKALQAAAKGGLSSLIERAQWLERLDDLLRRSLPAALAEHCRLANVDREKLVFLVNSPVWKNKLRLHGDVLLDAAAAAGLTVRLLVVKVVPASPTPSGAAAGKPLSEAVRESLRTTAQSVEDPELRAQLLKLASVP